MTQQSSIVEIERREIPAIEIYPSAIQMLAEHSSALFQCRLTAGIPTPTIEWKKTDGTELADTSDVELLPGGVIRFTNLRPEHQGIYFLFFFVENLRSSIMSFFSFALQVDTFVRLIIKRVV